MADTPTRYPLAWPAGWRRIAPEFRAEAKFGKARTQQGNRWIAGRPLTVAEACERVLLELQRMGVDEPDVVISTDVQTRMDGRPRSDRAEPRDPGACVYWRSETGAPRCMAIDRYDRVADNLAAIAATLEAMRAIERHGGAAILDRAFTGFTALPAPIVASMKRDWQVVLELQALLQPTAADVQQAYRRLAAQHHPDRGGSAAAMAEINTARDEALQEVSRG